MTSPTPPTEPTYADRTYRSGAGLAGGALLLLLVVLLGGDAVFRGEGQVPWVTLAALLAAVPLIVAFTLRPAVFANDVRIRIRNPLRVIVLPWADVAGLHAGYSSELITEGGVKYQLWAVPVSLRDRKKAARKAAGAAHDDPYRRTSAHPDVRNTQARMAAADQTMQDLRDLIAHAGDHPERPVPAASVRWAYEIIAPALVGLVLLVVLLAIG